MVTIQELHRSADSYEEPARTYHQSAYIAVRKQIIERMQDLTGSKTKGVAFRLDELKRLLGDIEDVPKDTRTIKEKVHAWLKMIPKGVVVTGLHPRERNEIIREVGNQGSTVLCAGYDISVDLVARTWGEGEDD